MALGLGSNTTSDALLPKVNWEDHVAAEVRARTPCVGRMIVGTRAAPSCAVMCSTPTDKRAPLLAELRLRRGRPDAAKEPIGCGGGGGGGGAAAPIPSLRSALAVCTVSRHARAALAVNRGGGGGSAALAHGRLP